MVKLRVPSWLQTSQTGSPHVTGTEKKKHSRQSLSNFAQLKSKDTSHTRKMPDESVASEDNQSSESRMVVLAEKIRTETEKLQTYLRLNGLPDPSFGIDAPTDFPGLPENMQTTRQEIVCATQELSNLVRGPRESVRWGVWSVCTPNGLFHSRFMLIVYLVLGYTKFTNY